MKKFFNKTKDKWFFLLAIDFLLLLSAYFFVMLAESKFFTEESFLEILDIDLVILLVSYTACFAAFGLHKIIWRYAGIRDLTRVVVACFIADVVYTLISVIGFKNYDRLTFNLLIAVVSPLFLISSRIGYRYILSRQNMWPLGGKNLAIIGAGDSGATVLKNFGTMYRKDYANVFLFDDDPDKIGRKISGHLIVGSIDSLPHNTKVLDIDEALIAIPSASAVQMNRIVDACLRSNIKFFTLPRLNEISKVNPKDYLKHLRKVEPSDLLGREEIVINDQLMNEFITDKVIIVTGGGGSIGSELCRQIAALNPKKLIILDNYENNAYEIQQELKIKYGPSLNLAVEIATVREKEKVDFLFEKYRPQVVFHAAAHKHVPLMETNPEEAVKNNVFGTFNVINAADTYLTEKFILISSDKAVNPTNIMGATKRICEMMVQAKKGRSKTIFSAVRFGNVLGSNGSVIPLFKKQIENGGPVTITDKRMIRYFMTIPEAVSLVLEAAHYSSGGDIFVLDMGSPVKIDEFARRLIKLMGYEPDVDIKVEYTGLRPGEKLYEELLVNSDNCYKTDNEKIFKEKMNDVSPKVIEEAMNLLNQSIAQNQTDEVVLAISSIVKTYQQCEELACSENIARVMKEKRKNSAEKAVI